MHTSSPASSFTTIHQSGAQDAPDLGNLPRGIAALAAALLVAASVAAWSHTDVPAQPSATSSMTAFASPSPRI